MGDRERILGAIRGSGTRVLGDSGTQVPGEFTPVQFDNLLDKAKEMICAVGGSVLEKGSDEYKNWKPEEDSLTIQGEFLVAENGAIWVEPAVDFVRSDIFLAEHLIIEVPKNEIVHNMHEAYNRLKGRSFDYGTFISGPSKTADIEQALVIGAQGPRSCVVVLT